MVNRNIPHDFDDWTITRLLDELEQVNRERTGDEDWEFDDEQRDAIRYDDGPLYCPAGPGSGKSEVVVARALKLIVVEEVDPESIMLTTFTEKAAQNLEDRIEDRLHALGLADAIDITDLWVGTLHQLAADIMREYRYSGYQNVELLDEDAQRLFVRRESDFVDFLAGDEVMDEWESLNGVDHIEDGEQWRWFEEAIGGRFNDAFGPNKYQATQAATTLLNRLSQYRVDIDALADSHVPHLRVLAEAFRQYEAALEEAHRCDFARLQERFLEFLDSPAGERFLHGDEERGRAPLRYLLADEYQDVNPLQQEIYFRLAEEMPEPNMTVVGDDDQSLYRFRGSTVDCFIEFPEEAADRFGIDEKEVEQIQLRHNHRSRADIVEWVNRYIAEHEAMQVEGARADGKEPMETTRDADDPRVRLLKGPTAQATADRVAEAIEAMHDEGYVHDYSQVALLFHSTREQWTQWDGGPTFVGRVVQALEARGIPVHNPRNKAFMEHEETQLVLAALTRCFDPDLEFANDNLLGRLAEDFDDWQNTFDRVVDRHEADELVEYVEQTAEMVREADEDDSLGLSPLDVFHRIRSCEPISGWTQGDERDPARAERLGRLTTLLKAFTNMASGLTGNRKLRPTSHPFWDTVSVRFLNEFYWHLCQYLSSMDLDDPEDEYDQIPSGYVQVMTVHQAKGLEFPVVFTGNLHYDPRMGRTYWIEENFRPYAHDGTLDDAGARAERDLIRKFYVSYSRAEENLILVGRDDQVDDDPDEPLVSLGFDETGAPLTPRWFDGQRRVEAPEDVADLRGTVGEPDDGDVRRPYSVIGDVLAFRRCARQHGFANEDGFELTRTTQLFYGKVVHETLDFAHRHYKGDIEGVEGGEPPSAAQLREYFDDVVAAIREQHGLAVNDEAIETAFDYIRRFNEREGPDLYPRVIDTERRLTHGADGYRLEGVVDVLTDEEGGETQIWDYKATTRPEEGARELEDYREQLYVYAILFREQNGYYPDRGVVYFVNEDDADEARFEIDYNEGVVEDALDRFEATVRAIEAAREADSWSQISPDEAPGEETCAVCDFRWDCPAADFDDR
jgi:superfamily I DNA/RNA helicase